MMKKLLAVAIVLLIPCMAFAQAGHIGLFVDAVGSNTDLNDASPGVTTIYVFHSNTPGATSVRFQVTGFNGFACSWISDSTPFNYVGDSNTGIEIAYESCLGEPTLIATINYFCMGNSAPCSCLMVLPDPDALTTTIETFDCALPTPNKMSATGGQLNVNPDTSTCECTPPVGVDQSTWGGIKALYR